MSTPMKYRKKPVVVEAMKLTAGEAHAVYKWIEQNTLGSFEPMDVIEGRKPYPASGVSIDPRDGRLIISTLEGLHWADMGDWIIRGVQGEFYPCKPDIFAATYEPVEAATAAQLVQAPSDTCDARTTVAGDPWRGCELPAGHDGRHIYGKRLYGAYPEYGIAAPSDTDPEAPLRAVIAEALALHERGETTYAPGEGMVTTEDDRIPDGCLYCRVPWPCQHVTILSRTPEPVQVEVTEAVRKALDDVAWEIHATRFLGGGEGPDTFYTGTIKARNIVRAAVAALGGGDPVACNCTQSGAHDYGSAGCESGTPQPSADPREVAHIECDCVPDLGPSHCHLCSERAGHPVPWSEAHSAQPEQVTTVEELDALPVGSVVMEITAEPFLGIPTVEGVFHKFPVAVQEPGRTPDEGWREWFVVAGHGARPASEIILPARVLYRPAAVTPENGEKR